MRKLPRGFAVVLIIASGACARAPAGPARKPPPPALLTIANAEAVRGAGAATLIALARSGSSDPRDASVPVRAMAVRGLGRVGTPEAIAALRELLAGADAAVATDAAAALGVASALGDIDAALAPAISADLVAAAGVPGLDRAVVLEALGRAGGADALPVLVAAVGSPEARFSYAASTALGRFGRRDLDLDGAARAALIKASSNADADIRYGGLYALAREHRAAGAAADPAVNAALVAALGDRDGGMRSVAVAALAKRGAVTPEVAARLQDADWRVAVQAARALAGAGDVDRDALAIDLVREWARLVASTPGASPHPLLEGLRGLAGHAERPAVRNALGVIAAGAGAVLPPGPQARRGVDPLVAGWAHCLALAALARPAEIASGGAGAAPAPAPAFAALATCGAGLPAHLRKELIADALAHGAGGDRAARATALAGLLADRDARVMAAALDAVPEMWPDLVGDARDTVVTAVIDRLGVPNAGVVSAAAGAATALMKRADIGAVRGTLSAPLLARAARPADDPELASTLLGALAEAKIAEGKAVCEHALGDASPAIAAAARACVKDLTGADPGPPATPPVVKAPPVHVEAVLGHAVTWTVETSRGAVVMELDASVAPWHVAAVVELTGRGFYDGLLFHRVVPDFVVQGGDPEGAGWGGPGFTLPSEPEGGQAAHERGFQRGAVGIADAGKDSGGSQWFAMHSHAPHLEGRYTRIGRVVSGMDVINLLVVGDRILHASVAVR